EFRIKAETLAGVLDEDQRVVEINRRAVTQLCLYLYRRLLLGQAMKGTKPPYQLRAINWNNLPRRKTAFQYCDRTFVFWRIEHGKKDNRVSNVKIRVACGEASVISFDTRRHRKRNDLQRFARFICHRLQQLKVRLKRFIVSILRIFLNRSHDRGTID